MKNNKNKATKHLTENFDEIQNKKLKTIKISIKGSTFVTIKANLAEALTTIGKHPNSIEVNDNYIRFSIDEHELLELKRILFNSWSIELNTKYTSISYKYLSTNVVKVIIINLYFGHTLLDLLEQNLKREQINRTLSKVIHTLETYIKSSITCQYCTHKIAKIEQERCDYCGIELNLQRFLYENIFA